MSAQGASKPKRARDAGGEDALKRKYNFTRRDYEILLDENDKLRELAERLIIKLGELVDDVGLTSSDCAEQRIPDFKAQLATLTNETSMKLEGQKNAK
jgi:hypothetical protein